MAHTSNTSDKYEFVSREEDIDFNRILREAPKGTNFILVEARTRDNSRVKEWALLIHNSVLTNPLVQGFCIHEDDFDDRDENHISPEWGEDEVASTKLFSYRVTGGEGKAPGKIKKQIEDIKKALNPKDTKTVVTLF